MIIMNDNSGDKKISNRTLSTLNLFAMYRPTSDGVHTTCLQIHWRKVILDIQNNYFGYPK